MPPSNKNSTPGGDAKVSLEVKTSSRPQRFSDVLKQKPLSSHKETLQKFEDKQKIKIPFRQPYFDEHRPVRITGESRTQFSKCSEKSRNERKAKEKDELVKHMSNLPGYLQKVERGENFQDKALNFGVLDWNQLKEWKYSDSVLPRGSAHVSSSGSNLARDKRKPPLHSCRSYPAKEKGFSQDVDLSQMKVLEKDFETSLRNTFDEHENPHPTGMPSSRNMSGVKSERSMRVDIDRIVVSEKDTSLSGFRKNEVPNSGKDVTSGWRKAITSREELQQSTKCLDKKHYPYEQKIPVLIIPKLSPRTNWQDIVHTSDPTLSFDGKSKEAHQETLSAEVSSEEVCFESIRISDSHIHARNLELLNLGSCSSEAPTASSQLKCIDTPKSKHSRGNGFDTPRSSDYETYESAAMKGTVASPSRRFSFSFGKISRSLSFKENAAAPGMSMTPVAIKSSPIRSEPSHQLSSNEVHSSTELYPYILHSCPLSTGKKTKDDPSAWLRSLRSVSKTPDKQSSEDVIGPIEFDAVQSRHSSPSRRLGFGLSKMKRSFSFKEGLSVPQLGPTTYATVKSGPLRSEVSDYPVTLNKNKDNPLSKSRSSPLRRLLDPILKSRVTYPCPSTQTSLSLTPNPNQVSETESFDKNKPRETMVRALLQVTIKNGLPLFKLVVNNSSDILVAMKNITPLGKQVVDSIYTFYSVHEINKKRSWISQVHKDKSYGFGYTAVGQMKGFISFCTETSADDFEDKFTRKEYILYSVDRKQGDGEAPELVPIRELASIIVRVPHGKPNDDVDERNIGQELTGKEFLEYLEEEKYLFGKGETEKFHNATVILSGADHSLPKNGVPSSLIQRWRSGGTCDCGGWDIGCKLRILTNEDQSCSLTAPSASCSNRDRFDLFDQGVAHDSKPIFRLAPFKKGIYSIEFCASISLLQAFSTCIAAISSQQSFDLSELNFPSEGKFVEESTFSGCGGIQIDSKAQELPGKNVPYPPSSPVGRV